MKILILTYFCVDFIRRAFFDSFFIILGVDFTLIFRLIMEKFKGLLYFRKSDLTYLLILLALTVQSILVMIFYNRSPLIVEIAAFKTYVLPLFFALVLRDLSVNLKELQLIRVLSVALLLCVLLQIFAPWALQFGAVDFSEPLEHSQHSWGSTNVNLYSAHFYSAKRLGRFCLLLMLIALIYRTTASDVYNVSRLIRHIVWISFICIILSGSREAFFIACLFFAIWTKFSIFKIFRFFIFLSGTSIYIILMLDGDQQQQLLFLFSNMGDIVARIVMLFPIFRIDWDIVEIFSWVGIGGYGQEAMLSGGISDEVKKLNFVAFSPIKNVFIYSILTFEDSAFTRIYLELGVFGLAIHLALWILPFIRMIYGSKYRQAASLFLVLTLVLKSHALMVDVFFMFILYALLYQKIGIANGKN